MNWLTDLFQEPAAVAIFASSLTFFGGIIVLIINQRSLDRKDERRWERERKLQEENRKWEKEQAILAEQRAEKERVRNIYRQSIRLLNALISARSLGLNTQAPTVLEIHDWLSILALHIGKNKDSKIEEFHTIFANFTADPHNVNATQLLELIKMIALEDDLLFPDSVQDNQSIVGSYTD